MADNPVTDTPPGPVESSTVGSNSDIELDQEFARLIDQLLPPEPTPRRRLATGFAFVGTAIVMSVAWALGFVVPNPSYGQSYSSSTSLVAVEEPDLVALSSLWFRNSSQATLTLADVDIDAPGLTLDRLEWYSEDPGEGDEIIEETFDDDGGSVTVSESEAVEFSGSFLEMMLRPGSTQPLPAVVGPGESVRVVAYMRVDDCTEPIVEPAGTWGTVRARWEYPDRPSWWHRWEPLDQPLQIDDGALRLHDFVTRDGEHFYAAGPLSGACEALELQP